MKENSLKLNMKKQLLREAKKEYDNIMNFNIGSSN